MGKRNIANEMSVEKLIGNGMSVSKKFDVDPDTKNEFGMLRAARWHSSSVGIGCLPLTRSSRRQIDERGVKGS